jgi:large subunit ribosomal protein L9
LLAKKEIAIGNNIHNNYYSKNKRKRRGVKNMKVILLSDIKGKGKKGEVVEVNDSYARNVLIAKKQGVEATPKALNDLKLQKKYEEKVAKELFQAAHSLASQLASKEVICYVKVGESGKIFGSVSSKEISQAVKEQLGIELDKKKFILDEQIKALGTYNVKLKLHPQVMGSLIVKVVGDEK